MNQDPLVSIVTPVYNGERYLRKCIESVLTQTYSNWDYTVVNNASTDTTLEIALEYAARDSRVRIHTNDTHVRINANYNTAFRQISPRSKYCKVVAADDWLAPDCVERMVDVAETHPTVAIVGAYGLKGSLVEWVGLPYPSTVVPGDVPCLLRLVKGIDVFGAATALLYRSDSIRARDPFFDEANFHADSQACLEILKDRDYGFVHQVLTYRRDDDVGSMAAVSEEFKTIFFAILNDLVTCGPFYLDDAQLQRCIERQLNEYYRYLASQLFRGRDRRFWKLHSAKLAAAGYPLNLRRLAVSCLSHVSNILLNPKSSVEKLVERRRERRRESGKDHQTQGLGFLIQK
jgi:glycosyltransferase involved in cell wall biosynthesis